MGTTHAITDRLAALLDEEHELRTRAMHHGGGLSRDEQSRLSKLESELDAVVRLLQQRRALEVFDDDAR
ncbi:DUF2630 family protein [Amycolatopsis rhabdoformis]|uniref:DUF2630 family protein n=1 Tax=Amycolatopsis rhabdoformis TaxID=1448059 RepID=A0ABZ1HXQ9_9PSEU|nr:DUF2630 family protein [Amycolatopsis rhabdoformis]WSE26342.1 DUF2630 family protein [Amycolatopsis rhabdoformis]